MYNSDSAGSFSWQSASFPGSPDISRAPLRRVISRARRAASRARAASIILFTIILATDGFSNRKSFNFSDTSDSTAALTSEDTSLSLVCEENLGSCTLTERTAVNPSRASSPVVSILAFFAKPSFSI